MDMVGGDQVPLFGNATAADAPELVGDALIADGDQSPNANPLSGWIGRLSITEYLSGVMAAGQSHATELLDTTRRLRVSAIAGAAALHNYGRSVAAATPRTFNKARSMARNAPEAIRDYFCIALMGGLALMGATDWDTRRDRIERYTLLPGEQRHYWGTPRYSPRSYSARTPVAFSPNWQAPGPRTANYPSSISADIASRASYQQQSLARDAVSGMPEWLLPLHHQEVERAPAEVTEKQADLAARYLAEFTGASSDIYAAYRHRGLTPPDQHIESIRTHREESARRIIRVRVGSITMGFSGPANDVYGQVGAWREMHPDSTIISDEPVLV